jgi:hypothetical protein
MVLVPARIHSTSEAAVEQRTARLARIQNDAATTANETIGYNLLAASA